MNVIMSHCRNFINTCKNSEKKSTEAQSTIAALEIYHCFDIFINIKSWKHCALFIYIYIFDIGANIK